MNQSNTDRLHPSSDPLDNGLRFYEPAQFFLPAVFHMAHDRDMSGPLVKDDHLTDQDITVLRKELALFEGSVAKKCAAERARLDEIVMKRASAGSLVAA